MTLTKHYWLYDYICNLGLYSNMFGYSPKAVFFVNSVTTDNGHIASSSFPNAVLLTRTHTAYIV